MPNARRIAKKNAKRGRVATPDVMMPGQKEWIPGVPAYQEGTDDRPWWQRVQDPGYTYTPPRNYPNASEAQLRSWATDGDQYAIDDLNNYFGGFAPAAITGGGSTGPTQFDRDLLQRRQELEELIAQNQVDMANLDREGEAAIASRNRESIERVELLKREAEAALLGYNEERDTLDRQLQQFQLNLSQRGQDITQRGQTLDAQTAQNSQAIQRYEAQLRAAQLSGDQNAIRDAQRGLDAANQQQAALQQYQAQLAGSGQQLQAMTSGGQQLGSLAGLEQQRQQSLIDLSQDPVDFMGFLNATGGGTSFLESLAAGRAPGGQSATTGLDPLGAGRSSLQTLLAQIGQRPAFDAAFQASQGLGTFQPPTAPTDILSLGPGPISAAPQIPDAPQLTMGTPEAVPGLGPEAVLSPDEQAIFAQFRAAAPGVPIDIAINIARNPAAARAFLGALPPAAPPPPSPPPPAPPPGDTGIGRDDPASFFPPRPEGLPKFDQSGWPIDDNGNRIAMPPGWLPERSQFASLQEQVVPNLITSEKFSSWVRNGADPNALHSILSAGGMTQDQWMTIGPLVGMSPRDASLKGGQAGAPLADGRPPVIPGGVDRAFANREFADWMGLFREGRMNSPANQAYIWDILASPNAVPPEGFNTIVPTSRDIAAMAQQRGNPVRPGDQVYTGGFDNPIFNNPSAALHPQNRVFFDAGRVEKTGQQRQQFYIPGYLAPPPGTGSSAQVADPNLAVGEGIDPASIMNNPWTPTQRPPAWESSNVRVREVFERFPVPGMDTYKPPTMAGGGELVIDEPSVILGLRTGRPLATLGEPTAKYPQGIPEVIRPSGDGYDVIPMGHGGKIKIEDPPKYRPPKLDFDDDLLPPPGSMQPIAPIAPVEKPPVAPSPYGPGVTPETPGGPEPPIGNTGIESQFVGQQPLSPGQLLRQLLSLSPQSYYGLLPSQQDILFSITRALGMPQQDAEASILRSFPSGLDPSRILTSGFSRGGHIRVA